MWMSHPPKDESRFVRAYRSTRKTVSGFVDEFSKPHYNEATNAFAVAL